MSKTTYRYIGPNSAVTLKVATSAGGLKDQDVILWGGQNVDLPFDHEVIAAMLHQGLLEPLSVGVGPHSPTVSQAQAPALTEDKADAAAKPKATK